MIHLEPPLCVIDTNTLTRGKTPWPGCLLPLSFPTPCETPALTAL